MITMTVIIQKDMDESNARFDMIFKELKDHKSGTDHMLKDFELTALAELEKVEQDRNVAASTVLAELASMKQDALDTCAAATNVNFNTEDETPSPARVDSALLCLNPDEKPKRLFPFVSVSEPMPAS